MSRLPARRQLAAVGLIVALTASLMALVAPGASANTRGHQFQVLRHGADSHRVHRVQFLLGVHPMTGYFNDRTRHAVRQFQNRRNIDATGSVNERTWNALGKKWHKTLKKRKRVHTERHRIMNVVRAQHGDPYVFGAAGPGAFDCSGLVLYVYRKATRINNLPHLASAEYRRSKHISRKQARPGDLVVFHNGSNIYHAAIYAGHNHIWHAPHSGSHVQKDPIWTNNVWFGRLLPNV